MIFGSVCSGIEAASVAWHPLGWRAAWLSEIEPFPSGLLAHHYPDVPNLGDMTALPEWIASGVLTAPDVFVGGTPCQAFSVAGLRGSLADARGNLSLTYCEIANVIDAARSQRAEPAAIHVWENVPGVLSTKDNAFGCFLAGLAGESVPLEPAGGKWPDAGLVIGPARAVAWRVLDAQFFGVAQRRRRVFVVASARDGFDPGAVLFEFDGVRRDTPPVRETREDPAGTIAGGARKRGGYPTDDVPLTPEGPAQIASTLNASFDSKQGLEGQHIRRGRPPSCLPMTMAHGQGGAEIAADRAPTLTCNHEAPILFLGGRFDEVTHTLRREGFDASEDGTGRGTPLVPVSVALRGRYGGAACEVGDDVAFTLRASSGGGDKPHVLAPVAFNWNAQPCQMNFDPDTIPTLTCSQGADSGPLPGMRVRRLTPRECERLQGFPDDYTRTPWRRKGAEECPDGPRYKALGNSMAVPCMAWIGARIALHLAGLL